jgi:hypothetical protein
MIHFAPAPEPPTFDERYRKRGEAWLREHPNADRPCDYWTQFKPDLAAAFNELCAYTVVHEPVGTVDHFISWDNGGPAYEWSNFRYSAQWVNSSKKTADAAVLDPFEVQDGWFEVLLPSLQLRLTDRVPPSHRAKAEYTLERLHLVRGPNVIRTRESWFAQFRSAELNLAGLRRRAPLLARAVEGAILGHLNSHGSINRSMASRLCYVPQPCARALLEELLAPAGPLRKEGKGRGVRYRLV